MRRWPMRREVVDDGGHAGPVVHADGRDAALPRAVPEGHDRDAGVLEVLDELGSVAQVAQEEDRVAVARLQDAPQRHGFVRALVGVAQDDVVAAPIGLQRGGLDGAGEEGVGDVADDDARAASWARRAGRGPGDWADSPGARPSP